MNYTKDNISSVQFNNKMKGYSKAEVSAFIEKVTYDYSEYEARIASLNSKIEELTQQVERYKELESTMQQTLSMAQATAEQVRKNAEAKASNIIVEAENKARSIVDSANNMSLQIKYDMDSYKRQAYLYKSKMMSMLKTQIELLQEVDSDGTITDGSQEDVKSLDSSVNSENDKSDK